MTRISDVPAKLAKPLAHAVIAPVGTIVELAKPNGLFNSLSEEIKKGGSVVIAEGITAQAGHALVMANGPLYNAKWNGLNIAADVAVTADATVPRVGSDRAPVVTKHQLGALEFPVVTLAQLSDGNHQVNSYPVGGKKLGAAVIVQLVSGRYSLAISTGINATSPWVNIDGTALATPSAETVRAAPFDKKPVVVTPKVVAIPFPVVAEADLAVAANVINSGDGTISGKKKGALIIGYGAAFAAPSLYMATGILPTDKWVKLIGDDVAGALTPA